MIGERMNPQPDADEWKLRLRLAAAYRAIDHFGWSELTANHVTLRVRRNPPEFLINPYGLLYSEITASSLDRVDVDFRLVRALRAADHDVSSVYESAPAATDQAVMRLAANRRRLDRWSGRRVWRS